MTQEELFERAKKVAPGGVHSPVRSFRSVGGNPVFLKEQKVLTFMIRITRSMWTFV